MLSEFVGTFLFMFIGIGGNSAVINDAAVAKQWGDGEPAANPAKILFIATTWGVAITVNAWAFFRISGGLFNPAVTMAMMLIRAVPPIDGLLDIISQLVGSILACAICYGLLPPGSLAMTELGSQTTVVQGLFIEMFLTSQIVIAVFMLATEKNKATFIAPVGIGLAVFACILMYVYSHRFDKMSYLIHASMLTFSLGDLHTQVHHSIPPVPSLYASSLVAGRTTTGYTGLGPVSVHCSLPASTS
jgi:aquaporin related protein